LWKRRAKCEWVLKYDNEDRLLEGCGTPLWQMTGEREFAIDLAGIIWA